jgi:hypothetical protein
MEEPKTLFLKCKCHGHGIELAKYNDEDDVWFSFWHNGFDMDTIWNRIKFACKFLWNGKIVVDDFVFSDYDCGELIDYLNDILGNNKF